MDAERSGDLGLVRAYMAGHLWVASRSELVSLGVGMPAIDTWLASGRLVPLVHGVYGFGRDIETRESAWRVAILAAGGDACLSGRSACELWNLVRGDGSIPRRIEVASAGRKCFRFRGLSPSLARTRIEVVHRDLEPGEVRRVGVLAVTSPSRALIDFAVQADPVALKFAFLEACRLGLFGPRDVGHCFRRIVGRRGATKLRPLVSGWVPELSRTRSPLEGALLLGWAEEDRPMPRVNEMVSGYEVDFYWPEHALIVEVDGRGFHSGPMARQRDREKQRDLELGGLTVLRFDSTQVFEALETVIAEIEQALKSESKGPEIQKVTDSR